MAQEDGLSTVIRPWSGFFTIAQPRAPLSLALGWLASAGSAPRSARWPGRRMGSVSNCHDAGPSAASHLMTPPDSFLAALGADLSNGLAPNGLGPIPGLRLTASCNPGAQLNRLWSLLPSIAPLRPSPARHRLAAPCALAAQGRSQPGCECMEHTLGQWSIRRAWRSAVGSACPPGSHLRRRYPVWCVWSNRMSLGKCGCLTHLLPRLPWPTDLGHAACRSHARSPLCRPGHQCGRALSPRHEWGAPPPLIQTTALRTCL